MFCEKILNAPSAATFNDFILTPGHVHVEPDEIDVSTWLTREIKLVSPFVSSPMDTVTESEMAIALARLGGLGFLHRNCSVEEEVEQARIVKRAESFIIRDVVSIKPDQMVGEAIKIMQEKKISGLPVVSGRRLQGIITKRDVYFSSPDKSVEDVMTKEVITAGEDVTIEEAKELMRENKIEKLPIVDDNKRLRGLITIKDIYLREKYPHATRDERGSLRVGAAISPFDLRRATALEKYVDILVIDVAHFHNENVIEATKKIMDNVGVEIIVGNIGTREAALDIATRLDGVAAVRAGVGSGSICSTSEITKAGSPTLHATSLAADAFNEVGADIKIIADGGIRTPGHAALAFAVGASTVMMGNIFARCKESPSELVIIGERYYKRYRGMGSAAAQAKRMALDRYGQPSKGIAEGVEGLVPYAGEAAEVVDRFVAGLKASMGYAGASSIKDMWLVARLARLSQLGQQEMRPHSIVLPSTGVEAGEFR
ncbi:MAG: IMP dehydrogenase [Candidatus Geothermarchaeales archaeon]